MTAQRSSRVAAMLGGAALALALTALPMMAGDGDGGFHLDFGINKDVNARNLGLPMYPGSWPRKDKDDDDSAAHIWAMAGLFGFKLAVMKLGTHDDPGRVAMFYRNALSHYGAVIDCSKGSAMMGHHEPESSHRLDCHDDHPKPGEIELKAGFKDDMHVVDVKPNGHGSDIDLVYVSLKGAN